MQEGIGRNSWEEQGHAGTRVECSHSFRVSYMYTALSWYLSFYVFIFCLHNYVLHLPMA